MPKKSSKSSSKSVRGMGKPSRAAYEAARKGAKEFPTETRHCEIGNYWKSMEVTTERGYRHEPMSGCEEIAFDISINNTWVVRTSALMGRPRMVQTEGEDQILEFVEQLYGAANMILSEYVAACIDQAQLDRRWAEQEYPEGSKDQRDLMKEFAREHLKHMKTISETRMRLLKAACSKREKGGR